MSDPMSPPSVVVFAPSPLLTITVEAAGTPRQEIHLHAGGQGFWVARMAALLGAEVSMCCALGGESGAVLQALIAREKVKLLSVRCAASNGVYIHARRADDREELARTRSRPLSRHEADELYGVALSAGLDAGIAMLTGVDPPTILDSDVYRRLAGDLRSNGVKVIADLSGAPLEAALAGGVDLLKISEEEILAEEEARGGGEVASWLHWSACTSAARTPCSSPAPSSPRSCWTGPAIATSSWPVPASRAWSRAARVTPCSPRSERAWPRVSGWRAPCGWRWRSLGASVWTSCSLLSACLENNLQQSA